MSDPIPPLPIEGAPPHSAVEVIIVRPPRRRYWVHVLLLVMTIGTTLVVGAGMSYAFQHNRPPFDADDNAFFSAFPVEWIWQQPARLLEGIPFSFSVLFILLCHEMGHYLYCVRYRVWATLPYFIPFPSLIGTMGAFIRIRSPIHNRTELFDIGIAGPIAGFIPAVLAALVGLTLSKPMPTFSQPPQIEFGHPILFSLVQWICALVSTNPVLRLPLDRVYLHPVAVAAWVGMFATSLNLLPGGQLDGGHIVYAVKPLRHRWITLATAAVLLPLAWHNWLGWGIWAILVLLTGTRHPSVPAEPPLPRSRRWLALLAAAMLVLTFMPSPIAHESLPEAVENWRNSR